MYKVYYGNDETDLSQMGSDYVLMDPSTNKRIYDAQVTLTINTAGVFKFTLAPDHPSYDRITIRGDRWVKVFWDDVCVFFGKVTDTLKGADMSLTVTAKDPLYELANVKFRYKSRGQTAKYYDADDYVIGAIAWFNEINLSNYPVQVPMPFNVGRPYLPGSSRMVIDVEPTEGKTISALFAPLFQQYGCYMTMRGSTIVVATRPYAERSTTLRLGENIKNIKVEVDAQDFPTAVYAMGGQKYPGIYYPDPYGDRVTHFRLAQNKAVGVRQLNITYDKTINGCILDPMYVSNGSSPSGTRAYSYIAINYHPSVSHAKNDYVGYGPLWMPLTWDTVNSGETIEVSCAGLEDIELKTSDNIDIIVYTYPTATEGGGDCIPREAGAAGPDIASDSNPIATTYQGVRLWVDYNTIILRNLAEQYGVRTFDYTDDTIRSPDTLFQQAFEELVRRAVVGTRVSVDAVDPAMMVGGTHLLLGDSVNVESEPHGLSGRMTLTSMTLNLNDPASNKYTFGNQSVSITDQIALLDAKMASMRDYLRG